MIAAKRRHDPVARRQTLGGPHTQSKANHPSENPKPSKWQRAALSAKRGEKKVSELKGASKSMYNR
jgi:Protein of unknwon function (DUF3008)